MGEKLIDRFKIIPDNCKIAVNEFLSVPQGNFSQEFTGGRVADRRVVFEGGHALVHFFILRGNPPDPQPS